MKHLSDVGTVAVAKNLPLKESNSPLFRVEALNVFNHTQFTDPPQSILGDHPKAATYGHFKTGHSEGLRHML